MSENTEQAPVALVTGAARRLGAAIASSLHRRGLRVAVHYRGSERAARELVDTLEAERPGSAMAVQADLADHRAPAAIADTVLDRFGRVDVLVNNASAFYPTPLETATPAQWDELMTSNLRAPYFLAQALAEELARHGGAIVNLVDIHGMVPLPRHSIYSQAKAGLIMQTRALARELAPQVRVNAVAPGAILWPEGGESPEVAEGILERVPLGRQGEPGDITGAVAFLALDAPYITGQVLAVDGGRLLNM